MDSNEIEKYNELPGCSEGEINIVLNEVFCKLQREFCKYMDVCPLGYKKKRIN